MMCVIGVLMAFSIDPFMGVLMIAMTGIVLVGAVFITRKASLIFEKLQNFLDRITWCCGEHHRRPGHPGVSQGALRGKADAPLLRGLRRLRYPVPIGCFSAWRAWLCS